MVVVCPSCTAKFKLDDSKVKPEGTKVRCSKCAHTFRVFPSGKTDEAAPAESKPTPAAKPAPAADAAQARKAPPSAPPPPEEPGMGMAGFSDTGSDDFSGFDSDFSFDDDDLGEAAPPPPVPQAPAPSAAPTAPSAKAAPPPPPPSHDAGDIDFGDLDSEFGMSDGSPSPKAAKAASPAGKAKAKASDDFGDMGEAPSDDALFGETAQHDFGSRDLDMGDGPELETADLPAKEFESGEADEPPARKARKASGAPAATPSASGSSASRASARPDAPKPAAPPIRKGGSGSGGLKWVAVFGVLFGILYAGPVVLTLGKNDAIGFSPSGYLAALRALTTSPPAVERPELEIQEPKFARTTHKSGLTLYFVEGRLANVSDISRSFLRTQIEGTLFVDGNAAATAKAYPGNPLSEAQLKSLPLEAIEEKMANSRGENMINLDIPAGESVPFIVVFSKVEGQPGDYALKILTELE